MKTSNFTQPELAAYYADRKTVFIGHRAVYILNHSPNAGYYLTRAARYPTGPQLNPRGRFHAVKPEQCFSLLGI